ncbi:hypothetical protein [Methylobacterium soli]|uniref:Uncharacterized protein n=1 Tax=Methylobacterium soli TaxID=553447 RepID=A0A6L3SSJ2_9HYPH|nr:hypothetical protein [Methylobacterium soli]KAB1070171.1 hypothetical protein F6X53_30350 [Methylobacterium soli]GJE43559.1 hypothetical protein AEGHOMDF_2738 [Methylobacterium soli]
MARPRTKRHVLIENAACLDIASLVRAGWLPQGQAATGFAPLVHHPGGTHAGWVYVASELTENRPPSLHLTFADRNGRAHEQRIALTSLPRPPFGGLRWFFICPQTGARACRLYLPRDGERFLSREAHGLRYAVEHGTQDTNDIIQACRLHARITGEAPPNGALSPLPHRPKGMRAATHARLTARLMRVQARVVGRLDVWLETLQLDEHRTP